MTKLTTANENRKIKQRDKARGNERQTMPRYITQYRTLQKMFRNKCMSMILSISKPKGDSSYQIEHIPDLFGKHLYTSSALEGSEDGAMDSGLK